MSPLSRVSGCLAADLMGEMTDPKGQGRLTRVLRSCRQDGRHSERKKCKGVHLALIGGIGPSTAGGLLGPTVPPSGCMCGCASSQNNLCTSLGIKSSQSEACHYDLSRRVAMRPRSHSGDGASAAVCATRKSRQTRPPRSIRLAAWPQRTTWGWSSIGSAQELSPTTLHEASNALIAPSGHRRRP